MILAYPEKGSKILFWSNVPKYRSSTGQLGTDLLLFQKPASKHDGTNIVYGQMPPGYRCDLLMLLMVEV